MASLNDLLNPEKSQDGEQRLDKTTSSSGSKSPSPAEKAPPEPPPRENSYYQNDVITRPHEKHENCPDNLDCLPDTTGRPQHTLPVILRCAILGSPKKRLTIREIYSAMERKYPYYKSAGPSWKQSVRHHLSLNRLFERQPRPPTEPGFGSYWTVNLTAPPGTKRPRKRGRGGKEPAASSSSSAGKKRERPRRPKEEVSPLPYVPNTRLRPVDAHSFSSTTIRSNGSYDDADEEMEWEDELRESDEVYESEEEVGTHSDFAIHYDRHMTLTSAEPLPISSSLPNPQSLRRHQSYQQQSQPRGILHGVFAGHSTTPSAPSADGVVERLRHEINGLKRQSSEALTLQYQMADKLNEARNALRVAESRAEDEKRRRVEAERVADEEAKRRRVAEKLLRSVERQSYNDSSTIPP